MRIHHELMLEEGEPSVLIAPDKLEAAVMRPAASAFGEDAYGTLAEKAGALLESLVIGHAFMDGNKRVAFAAMDVSFASTASSSFRTKTRHTTWSSTSLRATKKAALRRSPGACDSSSHRTSDES